MIRSAATAGPSRNHIGTLSLLGASAGFAVLETLHHQGWAAAPPWRILQSGFEAGMVGGFADWFAVSAIFRPIPSHRFRIKHTNLIVENRAKLSAGIVDMVQNRWLSPETLAEHLGRLSASRFILDHLAAPKARAQVLEATRDLLGRLAGSLDAPEIAAFLDRALRDQLAGLELGPVFGQWLQARIEAGDTSALWDFLVMSLANSVERGDFEAPIRQMLEHAMAHYKGQGVWGRLKGAAAERFFAYDQVSQSLSSALGQSLRDIQRDPGHPLRAKLDAQLAGFARKLAQGDPEACAALDHFQARLTAHAELGPLLTRILSRLQATIQVQLRDAGGNLAQLLERVGDTLLRELQSEPAVQAKLDHWVRRTILDLATRNHHLIGEMVESALAKLSDQDLVAQIEAKVGGDLQYIRLNGAVVGSLVGMALATLKLLLAP